MMRCLYPLRSVDKYKLLLAMLARLVHLSDELLSFRTIAAPSRANLLSSELIALEGRCEASLC
jgi:hypothetical protein